MPRRKKITAEVEQVENSSLELEVLWQKRMWEEQHARNNKMDKMMEEMIRGIQELNLKFSRVPFEDTNRNSNDIGELKERLTKVEVHEKLATAIATTIGAIIATIVNTIINTIM